MQRQRKLPVKTPCSRKRLRQSCTLVLHRLALHLELLVLVFHLPVAAGRRASESSTEKHQRQTYTQTHRAQLLFQPAAFFPQRRVLLDQGVDLA